MLVSYTIGTLKWNGDYLSVPFLMSCWEAFVFLLYSKGLLHTHGYLFEILLIQTEIWWYLPFSDWFGTILTSICFQINRRIVNAIWFPFDLIRFLCAHIAKAELSVCTYFTASQGHDFRNFGKFLRFPSTSFKPSSFERSMGYLLNDLNACLARFES